MKKFLIILLMVFVPFYIFTANPLARIYRPTDLLYKQIEDISIESGIVPFSTSGPISGYELNKHLLLINQKKLSAQSKETYEIISNKINSPYGHKDWGASAEIGVEFYLNTNPNTKFFEWIDGYNQRSPLVYGQAEAVFGSSGYGIISATIQKRFSEAYFDGFNNNIVGLGASSTDIQNNFPMTAFIGLSGSWYTFLFGKDPIKLGRGSTGNLMVNDHSPFHDFLEFSMFNKSIKYSLLAIPMNDLITGEFLSKIDSSYVAGTDDSRLGTGYYPQDYSTAGFWDTLFHNSRQRIYFAHRIEIDLFNWWRLVITEGTLFYTDTLDIRMLNPLMFMHNYQNFGEVNNSLGVETEIAISPNWLLNLQIFVDQIQTKGEQSSYGDNLPPQAYAFLLGSRFYYPHKKWTFSGHIEGVYTNPYAYLRTKDSTHNYDEAHKDTQYNLDFINVVNSYDDKTGVNWLGYPLGPDTIIFSTSLNSKYKNLFTLNNSLTLIIQGERGLKIHNKKQSVRIYEYPQNINPPTPSGPNPDYRFIIGTGGSFNIPKTNGTIYLQNYFINKWDNSGYDYDNQLTIGVKYKF